MRKRQKFFMSTLILLLGLAVFRFVPFEWKYAAAAAVTGLTLVLFAWSLKEGLTGVEWLTMLILPGLFTASFLLFTMVVPDDWLTGPTAFLLPDVVYDLIPKGILVGLGRMLIYGFFGLGQYALLLTENVYSVAAIRTISLLRAAHAVGFLMTILAAFLGFYTLVTLRLEFWWLGLTVAGISGLLLLPAIWSINLEDRLSREVIRYSAGLAGAMGMMAAAISFWPVNTAVFGLFLATMMYVYLGLTQHYFSGRLFSRTVVEYVTVGSVVLITMLLTSGLN